MLDDTIGAGLPASTPAIAFEDQRRLRVVKVFGQTTFTIVPTAQRVARAETRERRAILGTTAIL